MMPLVLTGFTFVFSIFFIFVTYRYIHELRAKKCECSNAPVRDVLEIVNYIQLGLLGIILLIILLIIVSSLFFNKGPIALGMNKAKSSTPRKSTPTKKSPSRK